MTAAKRRKSVCSKWCTSQHPFCSDGEALGTSPTGRFIFVGGDRPYLNVRTEGGSVVYHMGHRGKLRALARAILTATKPKTRRRNAAGRKR